MPALVPLLFGGLALLSGFLGAERGFVARLLVAALALYCGYRVLLWRKARE